MKYSVSIEPHSDGDALIIHLQGELDHHSADKLRKDIDGELNNQDIKCCVIDMTGVSFMDSSGLGVLLGRYKLISSRGGTMSIRNPNKTIDRILKMSGIYSIVEVTKYKEQYNENK